MTKPTKWLCAQRRLSLGIHPVWSESSLCSQWVAKDPSFLHADMEDSDQTWRMPRLIWVFAGRTVILLVLSWAGGGSVSFMRKPCLISQLDTAKVIFIYQSVMSHLVIYTLYHHMLCTQCVHYFKQTESPSHNFSVVKKLFKKCNPPDFEFYLSKLTKKKKIKKYGVMWILRLFSLHLTIKKQRNQPQS